MSDDPNMTQPPRLGATPPPAPRPTVKDQVKERLVDKDVPEHKVDAKINSAGRWWAGAVACFLVSLAFTGGAFYVALQKDMTIILAVMLGAFIVLPLLGALFCASQADGEATKAFLATVFKINREVRGKKPESHPEA